WRGVETMIEWLTIDARLVCKHGGGVQNKNSQNWVSIQKRAILVATDPEGRSIKGGPNANVTMGQKPWTTTLKVQTGYSDFVRIDSHQVCLRTVDGLTDGTTPGTVHYKVLNPGQSLVAAGS